MCSSGFPEQIWGILIPNNAAQEDRVPGHQHALQPLALLANLAPASVML
jgi:hypothetical protein